MKPPPALSWLQAFQTAVDDVCRASGPAPWLWATARALDSRRYVAQLCDDAACFHKHLPAHEARLLDLGTGSGILAVCMADKGCRVSGIDIDDFMQAASSHATMADEQRRIWPLLSQRFPALDFQHYHGKFPFADNFFDGVVAYGVFEHIPDELLEAVLTEVHRVLKPNGILCISYLPRKWALMERAAKLLGIGHHERLWGDYEAIRFLKASNFSIEDFCRIIFAPQHPPAFANQWQILLDAVDWVANFFPLSIFAHHLRIIAIKKHKEIR